MSAVYHIERYHAVGTSPAAMADGAEIIAIVDADGEELAAGRCGVAWDAAMLLIRHSETPMDRRAAVRLSVLMWALVWSWRDVAATVARWEALAPCDAYWLGRKAERAPAWRAAIGVALAEDHARA